MFLEYPTSKEVQAIRTNLLGPIQGNTSTRPALIVPLKKKITREIGLLKVYPGPTLALNVLNARAMVMWRSTVQANPIPSIWMNNWMRKWIRRSYVHK